jgi:hypothetical protein
MPVPVCLQEHLLRKVIRCVMVPRNPVTPRHYALAISLEDLGKHQLRHDAIIISAETGLVADL